jgi:hypothetical protein
MPLTRRYRRPALPPSKLAALVAAANAALPATDSPAGRIASATSEFCFYLQHAPGAPLEGLAWLLAETFEPESYGEATFLDEVRPGVTCAPPNPLQWPAAPFCAPPPHPRTPPLPRLLPTPSSTHPPHPSPCAGGR